MSEDTPTKDIGTSTPSSGSLRKRKKARLAVASAKVDGATDTKIPNNAVQYVLLENTDLKQDACAVLLIFSNDYLEYVFTYPFFNRSKMEGYEHFIKDLEAYGRVIYPVDKNGVKLTRPNPSFIPGQKTYYGKGNNRRENPPTWDCKCIAIPVDAGMSNEQILAWHNDTFVPKVMSLGFPLVKADTKINLHPTPIVRKQYWSSNLSTTDICSIMLNEFGDEEYPNDLGAFFKSSKSTIYSAWKPGTVPMNIMKNYKFLESHLMPEDWKRLSDENRAALNLNDDLDAAGTASSQDSTE
jgi:hypothetical protein